MVDEFKVLSDRDHVLLRPGMYLGTVVCGDYSGIINYEYKTLSIVPALIKMLEEIIHNSVDEHIRCNGEFAKNIYIDILHTVEGTEITVSDDGRGIPQNIIGGVPQAVLAWTKLRAGSNFDDSNRIGAGTNGVGSALTNIFSKSFIGRTCDGTNGIEVRCHDNMSVIKHNVFKTSSRGTIVKFIPDLARFGLTEFTQDHVDLIRDRLINLSILFPKINFTFNSEHFKFKNIKDVGKKFHENSVTFSDENIAVVFASSGVQEEFRCLSYVNGIYVSNGGAHVDFWLNKIIENLREHVKRKHKIDVLPNQIKQHLLFASWISNFPALRFDSQTKDRVTNSYGEMSKFFSEVDFDKISKQILNCPDIIDPMISAILYRKEMAEKLALSKKVKATAKIRIVNHIAAIDPDPEKRILCICEGLSAIGALISVRDPKTIGGYPIRGKPLNVRDMKPIEILKNKEISELLSIIGLEFGSSPNNLNYGKICIMSDADTDGDSIFCLLLNLFSNWPDLFTMGKIYRIMTPLYVCTKGKDVQNFYTKEDFDKFNPKGYEVEYCKGLGTMSKDSYRKCIMDPVFVKVSADSNDMDHLIMAFGDSAQKRKDWILNV